MTEDDGNKYDPKSESFDPRTREDLEQMWDRAKKLETVLQSIRAHINTISLFPKPGEHEKVMRDIHETLEEVGF